MARTRPKPVADHERVLEPASPFCAECGKRMQIAYHNKRHLLTLQGRLALTVPVRVCRHAECQAQKKPVRPWEEGALALPQSECGLDLIAFVGHCRYAKHQSLVQIHQALRERAVDLCERSVCNLLHRYEELVALNVARALPQLKAQGRVVLAIDGLQPDKGHEVLWVLRDCLSGTIVLARSLLSAAQEDLAALLREVKEALPVPICGVISDGQNSLRPAVEAVLPDVPHQLCQFHYLREAARPVYEADRHAKKELKKRVRGIRPLEHTLAERNDEEAQVVRGYCLAVRSALTDDGQPPLEAPGLRLQERLTAITASLSEVEKKGGLPKPLLRLKTLLEKALAETRDDWDAIRTAYTWVHQAARLLDNKAGLDVLLVRRHYRTLLAQMRSCRQQTGLLGEAARQFWKVTKSYWRGLFACYTRADLPHTNNALEQQFGSYRHHERRCTGRKVASAMTVVRGPVRLVAALSTPSRPHAGADLRPRCLVAWRALRQQLQMRHHERSEQRRFRKDPQAYLANLEQRLMATLPT